MLLQKKKLLEIPWFSLLGMVELGTLVVMELDLRSQQVSTLWTKRVRSSLGHVTCWHWETVFTGSRGERPRGRCDWLGWVCTWSRVVWGGSDARDAGGESSPRPVHPTAWTGRRCWLGASPALFPSSLPTAPPPLLHLFFSPFHILSHPLSSPRSSFPPPPILALLPAAHALLLTTQWPAKPDSPVQNQSRSGMFPAQTARGVREQSSSTSLSAAKEHAQFKAAS